LCCFFSRVVDGFRRGDGGLLLCGGLDAESSALVHIRGPHVPRDLSSLLRNCRHVSDESQVSERAFFELFIFFSLFPKFINLLIIIFRVMAAALSLTMGRLGALVGNLVFGYLIDLACVVPIILFAAFLFGKKFFPFKFN